MKTAIIAALAALAGAGITASGPVWLTRHQERVRRRHEVATLLSKYQEPLVSAAYELQSRLYNIVRQRFLEVFHKGGSEADRFYAETSTLWILGQFLGWKEILRREIQFLNLGDVERNKKLQRLLEKITKSMASDAPEATRAFLIFRADQRAAGEIMIVERTTHDGARRSDCMGYAEFCSRVQSPQVSRWFVSWAEGIRGYADSTTVREPQRQQRLVLLQRALVDLIEFLDEDRSRFPLDTRGKLPLPGAGDEASPPRESRSAGYTRTATERRSGDGP